MRRLLLSAASGVALSGLSGASGAAATVPVVQPGRPVAVDASGFAARSTVTVQLVGSAAGHRVVMADRRGRVHTSYPAPTVAGTYRVLVSGPVRGLHRTGAPPATGGPHDDVQVVSLAVPLVIGVPFQVGGFGVDAGSTHTGPGGSGTEGTGLSATGSDLRTPLIIAAGLLAAGALSLLAGRRRAHR